MAEAAGMAAVGGSFDAGGGGGSGWAWDSDNIPYAPVSYALTSDHYLEDALTTGLEETGYEPNPDTTGNGFVRITIIEKEDEITLELNGEEEVNIIKGVSYIDEGATLTINGEDASEQLTITGSVNTNVIGTYTITYTYEDYSTSRTVNVLSAQEDEFEYKGHYEEYIVPATGLYKLEVWGAEGGSGTQLGGKGGYSTGIVQLTKGTTLYVYVGGRGNNYNSADKSGGFNGGGPGNGNVAGGQTGNPSGGGATDIRIGTDSLYSRVIVAGAGGGGGSSVLGGYGGGTVGQDPPGASAKGGTQIAGGNGGATTTIQSGFGRGASRNSWRRRRFWLVWRRNFN